MKKFNNFKSSLRFLLLVTTLLLLILGVLDHTTLTTDISNICNNGLLVCHLLSREWIFDSFIWNGILHISSHKLSINHFYYETIPVTHGLSNKPASALAITVALTDIFMRKSANL